MILNKIREYILRISSSLLTIILVSFFIISLIVLGLYLMSILSRRSPFYYEKEPLSTANKYYGIGTTDKYSKELYSDYKISDETRLEVREGSIRIDSKSVDEDRKMIEKIVKEINGSIENFYKEEGNQETIVILSIYIPSNQFDYFLDYILENFKVRSYNVRAYKISVREEINELDVIRQTLSKLDKIENEIMIMPINEKKISYLIQITNEKMGLVSKMRDLQGKIAEKMKKGDYSIFSIELVQSKPFRLIDENYEKEIMRKVRVTFSNFIHALTGIIDILPFIVNIVKLFIQGMIILFLGFIGAIIAIKSWRFLRKRISI